MMKKTFKILINLCYESSLDFANIYTHERPIIETETGHREITKFQIKIIELDYYNQ